MLGIEKRVKAMYGDVPGAEKYDVDPAGKVKTAGETAKSCRYRQSAVIGTLKCPPNDVTLPSKEGYAARYATTSPARSATQAVSGEADKRCSITGWLSFMCGT